MTVTRAQAMAYTREMMDATSSARWTDAIVRTALGIVSGREYSGILGTNQMYRFAQRIVTLDASSQFAYTALNSGSGDSAQTWNRILSITDGTNVYREVSFQEYPLATSQGYSAPYSYFWYDAGANVQMLPIGQSLGALTVSVNYTPPRVDQLSSDSVVIDFPDGSETILWLEAAAYLLSKGGAENDAAQTMRAMADQERQNMYGNMSRRAARPQFLQFPDRASEWGA